jgi:hypothetical protein
MSSIGASAIVFGCVAGGALFGMYLHRIVPEPHLGKESSDVVKMGMGLVATMSALILGLLVSSAKGHYDTQSNELTEMSSKVVLLDHVLAHYGPETKEARRMLRSSVGDALRHMWSKRGAVAPPSEGPSGGPEALLDNIQELSPENDKQRALQTQAVNLMMDLGRTRWLQHAQGQSPIPTPLPLMLVFWLTAIFVSFGLYAPANATVLISLFVAALSVSGAILLILELYKPYGGLIQLPDAPLRDALMQLSK